MTKRDHGISFFYFQNDAIEFYDVSSYYDEHCSIYHDC